MSSPLSPQQADSTAITASTSGLPALLPSINPEKLLAGETYTYTSPVPSEILANPEAPVILGVDEAGRGPVLGPMVYAAAYCLESYSDTIKELGFADSKKLTHATRTALLTSLTTSSIPSDPSKPSKTSTLPPNLGWKTTLLSPPTISTSMLRPHTQPPLNLNALAHHTTISLVRTLLSPPYSLNITSIYIDTVGPPQSYTTLLQKHFPTLKITVTKQADSIYPIVSAASVCAKVTRDVAIDVLTSPAPVTTATNPQQAEAPQPLGSGYPGDAKTISYLKSTLDPVFGWRGEVVRFSWATAKDLLENAKRSVKAEWAEEGSDEGHAIMGFFSSGKDDGMGKGVAGWYGRSVGVAEF
ncbi:ribonuclease H-like domain-containing protein [Terfezia claveryi]|nr:ribonuclease H-like domain-containing protein [Terfezia claveryi]